VGVADCEGFRGGPCFAYDHSGADDVAAPGGTGDVVEAFLWSTIGLLGEGEAYL